MKNEKLEQPSISWGRGLVLREDSISDLEGKLLTFLEALGLKETQEKSAKDILRQIVWDLVIRDGVWIGPKTHTLIKEKSFERPNEPRNHIEIVE